MKCIVWVSNHDVYGWSFNGFYIYILFGNATFSTFLTTLLTRFIDFMLAIRITATL